MTSKEAYELAMNNMKTMDGWVADKCFEYESVFVFRMIPPRYQEQDGELFDCMRSVNKKTKMVRDFQPFHLSTEEYNNGREIVDFKSDNDELIHYGILGQKWGVRRYQNKDGTLTNAGKKRYDSEMDKLKKEERILKNKQRTKAKFDNLESKRKEIDELRKKIDDSKKKNVDNDESKKKSYKSMSDEELRAVVNRMQLEQQYKNLSPKQISLGKKFADTVTTNIILPGVIDLGRQLFKTAITKKANEMFKLDDEYKTYTNNKKK